MNLTEFEQHIMSSMKKRSRSMSQIQIESFVSNTQLTTYKKVQQCYIEASTRISSLKSSEIELKRQCVKRKKLLREIEKTTDPLDIELLQLDLEELDMSIANFEEIQRENEKEARLFVDLLQQYVPTEAELELYSKDNKDEERKYWVARMGKQAAMDLMALGRISAGNLDAITNMSQDDQLATLKTAISFAGGLQNDLASVASVSPPVPNSQKQGISTLIDQLPGLE